MKIVNSLSNELGQNFGIEVREISLQHGRVVDINVEGTSMDDLKVCLTIDDVEDLAFRSVINESNINLLKRYKFDEPNAKVVKRYLDNSNIDYMHVVNDNAQHFFATA